MEDPHSSLQILLFILLLLLSSFFSGSETALMSVNRVRIRSLMEQGSPKANLIAQLISKPEKLLSTILIGNNLVNIAASSIATAFFLNWFGSAGIALSTLIVTFFVLLIGEITPKTLAVTRPEQISLSVIKPVYWLMILLTPVITVFSVLTNQLIKLFRLDQKTNHHSLTEDEIKVLVDIGQEQGILDADETNMIQSIFDFGDLTVAEIIVPRVDLFALPANMSVSEAAEKTIESPFSRIPIYEESIDNIVGVIHVKDLLKALLHPNTPQHLKAISRPPLFVPEGKKVHILFEELRREKNHFAIVIDEYGATAGIVTLEDLIEEIVGEIDDEYDPSSSRIRAIDPSTFIVEGNLNIRDANELFDLELSDEDADTLAGIVFNRLGHVPQVGETVELEDVVLKVENVSGQRIVQLKAIKKKPPED